MPAMPATRVFVYGTLKRGQRNHHYLHGQVFLGEAATLPHYRLLDSGPYPCLVKDPLRGLAVQGEVWEVDDDVLPRLDRLEEVPDLYHRGEVVLQGYEVPILTYFYSGDVSGFVDCAGRWPREKT